jgi:hypothetical protein
MLLGMQKNVSKWTLTLPSELPLWELESQWTSEFLESDCKSQNSLIWRVPYIIGVQETAVEKPTQDLNVPFEAIREEEQEDSEKQEN